METEMATRDCTVNVTEFKAKCLELFKDIERGKLTHVTVTRRGHPVATVLPPRPAKKVGSLDEVFADMRGLITVAPGVDLTEPLDIPEPDDPFLGKKKRGDAAA
jgi:antitoxin (DNA-binding transcriptional repressor) of toxin-antitoxin stability system